MEKIKKGWIFLLLVFFLTLMSPSSNAVYAGDFNSLMNNTSTYGLIERPEDFLKDKEKAKEWEKKESIRIEKELKKEGREFSKAVRKEALSATDKHTGNLTKGFRLGPVKHINGVILEEFMAEGRKNPHWHLVENGHEIITPFKKNGKKLKNGGKCVGFVPGKRIVSAVLKNWGGKHEERLRRVLERVKDDAGL